MNGRSRPPCANRYRDRGSICGVRLARYSRAPHHSDLILFAKYIKGNYGFTEIAFYMAGLKGVVHGNTCGVVMMSLTAA
jgi:hypothetical protein